MVALTGADLFCDIPPPARLTLGDLLPGLAVVALCVLAAGFLADHYGAPLTLMALLIGLALNFLVVDHRLAPGLDFTARSLLRLGIVLLGLRITAAQIVDLGPTALISLAGIMAVTLSIGIVTARRLGFPAAFGIVAGGAVAICGASAAMALAAAVGARRISGAQLALVLVCVSAMSAAAMIVYPLIANAFGFSHGQAGFLLGASIHEVAQSIGAGYAFSPAAGDIAAIVKLARVALLTPVLGLVAWFSPIEDGERRVAGVPWFVLGFFALVAANSLGLVPTSIAKGSASAAGVLLAAAVGAAAVRAPLPSLFATGPRAIFVVLVPTLTALLLSLMTAGFLIR